MDWQMELGATQGASGLLMGDPGMAYDVSDSAAGVAPSSGRGVLCLPAPLLVWYDRAGMTVHSAPAEGWFCYRAMAACRGRPPHYMHTVLVVLTTDLYWS